MKKILIINLRRIGDIYGTGHLVNSLASQNDTLVSILTYQENAKAIANLKNVSNIYFIDRKEIITLKSNKLFADGLALELLFNQLEIIKTQKWDKVVNYSNDLAGTYISSYLKNSSLEIIGPRVSTDHNISVGNDWEIMFNDILPTIKYSPLHFVDCYHQMLGINLTKEGEKISSNPEYNQTAFLNFQNIKHAYSEEKTNPKIIGIQLKTSEESKDISFTTLVTLLAMMKTNKQIIPVMIIAPTNEERTLAENLNRELDEPLVTIEADLEALSSVLINLDLLITPDTAIKHIADLCDTPLLEVSLGNAPFLKQGTYSSNNYILTDEISNRNFTREKKYPTSKITSQDILTSALFILNKDSSLNLSAGTTLYRSGLDQNGVIYIPIAGNFEAQIEISRQMSRQLVFSILNQDNVSNLSANVDQLGTENISQWLHEEKNNLISVSKDLLGTLRTLNQAKENNRSSREFVTNLSKMFSHAESSFLTQIPFLMFKRNVEAIQASTFHENIKSVEMYLYELKANLQTSVDLMKHLESRMDSKKINAFQNLMNA